MADKQSRLLALPAELRNNIFELAFTDDSDLHVDLLKASPPSKALLLTCREINNEAKGFYKTAYRNYWPKHVFFLHAQGKISSPERKELVVEIDKLADADLDHIKHLNVDGFGSTRYPCFERITSCSGWKVNRHQSGSPGYLCIRTHGSMEFTALENLEGFLRANAIRPSSLKQQLKDLLLHFN